MNESTIDVSVLLIFFNRPEPFSQVFEQVKKARPSRLFLYQDGPRNDKDIPGIEACRKIVSEIDWECEVHTFFQEKNQGCDPSEYIAQKWAFSLTDKCIIIEDDDVPSLSFFTFCKELLDRYENDNRIWMISGFNHEEISKNINEDYFFTEFMSISGWATWRRVIDTWDGEYNFLNDSDKVNELRKIIKDKRQKSDLIEYCREHKATGRSHYETILWTSMLFNKGLAIMPTKNLINNIGISADSTHFSTPAYMLPKEHRKIFLMNRYELEFPLKHPSKIEPNHHHKEAVYKILCWDHPWIKIGRSFEELFINIRYGNYKNILRSIRKRINKIFCS